MTVTDKNMIQFHLEVLYGISVKHWEKKKERALLSGTKVFGVPLENALLSGTKVFGVPLENALLSGTKVFGVPLENAPRCYIAEFGLVPCFLVDSCSFLLERVATVGLFRKPGSLSRIKILRGKLNGGEACPSAALPYDVATLIKQFCRELPVPLFPPELHAALLEAQTLSSPDDRTRALQLLSCLLPAQNASCLHFLFDFLSKVSQRCSENLMTSSNLATIFAPCLLPPPNKMEMSEGRLELRVLVLRAFIENPHLFGVIPEAVKDCMEYLSFYCPGDPPQTTGNKKRHSFKVIRSAKMVPWIQGRSKFKHSEADGLKSMSEGRPVLRRSFGVETFHNIKLFRSSPGTARTDPQTGGQAGEGSRSFKTEVSLEDGLAPSEECTSADRRSHTTPKERLKRDLGQLRRFSRGQEVDGSPLLTAVGKLPLWRRRTSL